MPQISLGWQGSRDTGCFGSFWCQGWSGWMAAWNSIIKCFCLWWHLLGGRHQHGCGQNWPLQHVWVSHSNRWWSTQGHWCWSLQGSVPWGWAGGGQHCPREELLKLSGHAGAVSCCTRTLPGRMWGIRWCWGFAETWGEGHLVSHA